ncbi:DsbC family protein [Burkholderia pyrrocinia]|uniref:DsbC family protein n=1 Tax=Burkholderia pyrrocinia TaxID=60550 RepID=UPI002AB191F7|nr:DsbC family protein [Burkholderia pyrrocinia]
MLAASLLTVILAAMHSNSIAAQEEEKLKQILQAKIPELKIETVSESPIVGLYEVVASSRVFYSNPTGAYVVIGNIINTSNQKNLTETRFNEINSIAIADLPFHYAIKTKNGNGNKIIATFFDPNCSFCKKMSPELDRIPNATIYIFLHPTLSADSVAKSEMILCSDNPSLAWKQWVQRGKIAALRTPCQSTAIKELVSLGKKLNIKGTPTTFLPSGERVEGFISEKELTTRIDRM